MVVKPIDIQSKLDAFNTLKESNGIAAHIKLDHQIDQIGKGFLLGILNGITILVGRSKIDESYYATVVVDLAHKQPLSNSNTSVSRHANNAIQELKTVSKTLL